MIRVALDGLRSRALLSVGTLVLLVVAVASAVLGPAFTVAVSNSYAIARLAEEPNPVTGRVWEYQPTETTSPERTVADARDAVDLPPGQTDLSAQLETQRHFVGHAYGEVQLLAKPGACDHLELEGRCPTRPGETAILAGDAEQDGLKLGDRMDLGPPFGGLTVVGIYSYPSGSDTSDEELTELEDYWFEPRKLATVPARLLPSGGLIPRRPAPYLVILRHFEEVPTRLWQVRLESRVEVTPDLEPDDIERLGASEESDPLLLDAGTLAEVSINDLGAVTADIDRERDAATASVTPAVVSLILVSLALLSRLTSAASDLRTPDLALASLRGAGRRRVLALALAEPLLLVALAIPLGAAAGVLIDRWLIDAWLAPGLPLRVPAASGLALAGVVGCAVGVCFLAVRGALNRTLADQLTGHQRPRQVTRAVVLAVVTVLALTLVVTTAAVARPEGGATDWADLVLPVLIATACGIGATAAARATAVRLARRPPRGVVGFLAVRAVARRAAGTLVVLPLTVAIAVCAFGVGVHEAAATWRTSVAATQAPADTVWATELPMGEAVALTHELDPDGRWLMAAGTYVAQDVTYVAVDGSRLGDVARWDAGWTPGTDGPEVGRLLSSGSLPEVTGRVATLTVEVPDGSEDLTVELRLRDADGGTRGVYVGQFPPGTSTRSETLGCRAGCTVEGLVVGGGAALPVELAGSVAIGPLEVDGEDRSDVLTDGGWQLTTGREIDQVATEVAVTPRGLTIDTDGYGLAGLTAGDVPAERPVVAGREVVDRVGDVPAGTATSTSGTPPPVDVALVAESLPFLGPQGALIDYTMLSANRSIFEGEFDVRVLARAGAPDRIREALGARGLTVATTNQREQDKLDGTAYAIVLRLYLVTSLLVLLMAIAGLAVSTAVQLPGRRLDAASLSVVGVRRRSVLLAVALEQVVVLGSAGLAGLAAGSLAQWIVLRRITLGQVEGVAWPRVVARVDPGLLAAVAAGVAVLLGCVAVVSAWLTVRRARGASLREKAR